MNWDELQNYVAKICSRIDFKPEIIVAVARGGVIPGVMIAEKFGIKDMYSVAVKKQEGKRKIMTKIMDDLHGKKILLVEDAIDTGKSMLAVKKYLESEGASVKTAALFIKGSTAIMPDYMLETSPDIIFPWGEVQK
ncbi:MAG: phosphoribosyltransferase family protein [Candidatus Woesearchaeota archaeon]